MLALVLVKAILKKACVSARQRFLLDAVCEILSFCRAGISVVRQRFLINGGVFKTPVPVRRRLLKDKDFLMAWSGLLSS